MHVTWTDPLWQQYFLQYFHIHCKSKGATGPPSPASRTDRLRSWGKGRCVKWSILCTSTTHSLPSISSQCCYCAQVSPKTRDPGHKPKSPNIPKILKSLQTISWFPTVTHTYVLHKKARKVCVVYWFIHLAPVLTHRWFLFSTKDWCNTPLSLCFSGQNTPLKRLELIFFVGPNPISGCPSPPQPPTLYPEVKAVRGWEEGVVQGVVQGRPNTSHDPGEGPEKKFGNF